MEFNFNFPSRRHHLNNWSMTKENHSPILMLPAELPAPKLAVQQQQKPFERTHGIQQNSPPNLKNATDLFELLERCQSQRLDDQRCVLPSYFSQVSYFPSLSLSLPSLH